jgi:hypothetical protein
MLSTSSPKTLRRAAAATPMNSQLRSPGREPENGNTAMSVRGGEKWHHFRRYRAEPMAPDGRPIGGDR